VGCAEGGPSYPDGDSCVCAALLDVGEQCFDAGTGASFPCDPAIAGCDYTTGVCAALGQAGESCDVVTCAAGLECADQVCVTPLYGTTAGDPCTPELDSACGATTTNGLVCVDEDADGEGVCTLAAIVGLGEACDTDYGYDIDGLSHCANELTTTYCAKEFAEVTGICTARPTAGESCFSATAYIPCDVTSTCEYNFDFTDATCVALPALGEECDPDQGCGGLFNYCDEDQAIPICRSYYEVDVVDYGQCYE
jgi:hypothetical protein